MNTNSEGNVPANVLVVDDEPAILIMVKKILHQAGFQVRTAQSGREGLKMFQEGPYDLVTLDRSMPEMNGEEVAREIRRSAPQIPLVLITGFPNAVTQPELFDAILAKPFRMAELLQCITQALGKHSTVPGQLPQCRMAGSVCQ